MARKPVLTGGKKDEIIATAMKLFFEKGYEATSVRMIMDQVGGEIGMFYHYFASKEELFNVVTDTFFRNYEHKFTEMISHCHSVDELIDVLLPVYNKSMNQFASLRENMHWTIQYALHYRTMASLKPAIITLLQGMNIETESYDILAGQLINGISATIHSPVFEIMEVEEQKKNLSDFIRKLLQV